MVLCFAHEILALNPTRIDTISTYDGAQPLKCNDIGMKIIESHFVWSLNAIVNRLIRSGSVYVRYDTQNLLKTGNNDYR